MQLWEQSALSWPSSNNILAYTFTITPWPIATRLCDVQSVKRIILLSQLNGAVNHPAGRWTGVGYKVALTTGGLLRVCTNSECESCCHLHSHDLLHPTGVLKKFEYLHHYITMSAEICWNFIERGLAIACTWFTPQRSSRGLENHDLW